MIGNGPFGGFRVVPQSITAIRAAADNVRKVLQMGNTPEATNIGRLLDQLSVDYGITYDIIDPENMPHSDVEACCSPETMTIHIRLDVFEQVCLDEPRSRFTVMHELGHLLLGHRRTINRTNNERSPKIFEDSEWQANQFAAELLMPLNVIQENRLNSASAIQMHFRVSHTAAKHRADQLRNRGELPI